MLRDPGLQFQRQVHRIRTPTEWVQLLQLRNGTRGKGTTLCSVKGPFE